MNANELADAMQYQRCDANMVKQASTMLRQQQDKLTKYELRHAVQRDRIAILEAQLKKAQKNG